MSVWYLSSTCISTVFPSTPPRENYIFIKWHKFCFPPRITAVMLFFNLIFKHLLISCHAVKEMIKKLSEQCYLPNLHYCNDKGAWWKHCWPFLWLRFTTVWIHPSYTVFSRSQEDSQFSFLSSVTVLLRVCSCCYATSIISFSFHPTPAYIVLSMKEH